MSTPETGEIHLPGNESLPERQESVFDYVVLEKGGDVVLDASGRKQIFDDTDPLPRHILELTGASLPFIAKVGLPKHAHDDRWRQDQFFILDARDTNRYSAPYVLLKDENNTAVVKGIWPDQTVVIGRSSRHGNAFAHSARISGTHFSLHLHDETIAVADLDSSNGTAVSGFVVKDVDERDGLYMDHDAKGDFTENLIERAQRMAFFDGARTPEAPYGTMKGFAVIGRDSPTVRGGVYGTLSPKSEFVLVNTTSPQIRALESMLTHRLTEGRFEQRSQHEVLQLICDITADVMRYDLDAVERMSQPYYETSGLIALTDYIDKGVGVCRQQALLAAVLLEHAVSEGFLSGTAHVERNRRIEARGAHAWAVFSDATEDIIVDPAQGRFVGTRRDASREGRWPYYVDASPRA